MAQGLYALPTFAVTVLLARYVSAAAVGEFMLYLGIYTTILGLFRAAVAEPYLATSKSITVVDSGRFTALAAQFALTLFTVGAALSLTVLSQTVAGLAFLVTAPMLILHDSYRVVGFASGTWSTLAGGDLVRLLTFCGIATAGVATGQTTVFTLAYTLSCLPTAITFLLRARFRGSCSYARGLLRRLGGALLLEASLFHTFQRLYDFLVASVLGFGVLGQMRLATTVLGPVQIVTSGVGPSVLADHAVEPWPRSFRRHAALPLILCITASFLALSAAPALSTLLSVSIPWPNVAIAGAALTGTCANSALLSILKRRSSGKAVVVARLAGVVAGAAALCLTSLLLSDSAILILSTTAVSVGITTVAALLLCVRLHTGGRATAS